jgi:LacI family transcriptional regulator
MDNINIKKLAKALNLSTSTVSRAFRNNNDINKATKERILARARELGYQPNHYASNLRERKSRTIAVIVPELANNFFLQVINGLEQVASSKGYHILIYLTGDNYEKEISFINHLSNGRVDGIMMSVSGETASEHNYLHKLREKNIPLVFFDRIYDDIEVAKVTTDDYESSFRGTEHLIQAGCKHIAFLVINKNLSIGKKRLQGYLDALQQHGLPFRDELVVDCHHDHDQNLRILRQALPALKPDGLFASVERLAIAGYYVCQELGIRIPEQLKIISFSSLEIAPLLNPSLSTISQPAFDMGIQAATLLFEAIEGGGAKVKTDHVVLKSELVQRKSTSTAGE